MEYVIKYDVEARSKPNGGNMMGKYSAGRHIASTNTQSGWAQNAAQTNHWLPLIALEAVIVDPEPEPQVERIRIGRSYDGGATWGDWREYEEVND